jgi:succinate-semialdehyde dehydrogenase/glutarate-semialdehyde dehydrogenase
MISSATHRIKNNTTINQTRMANFKDIHPETIDSAIDLLKDKIDAWCNKSCRERAASLRIIADQVRFKSDELSKLITLEVDKLLAESKAEIALR